MPQEAGIQSQKGTDRCHRPTLGNRPCGCGWRADIKIFSWSPCKTGSRAGLKGESLPWPPRSQLFSTRLVHDKVIPGLIWTCPRYRSWTTVIKQGGWALSILSLCSRDTLCKAGCPVALQCWEVRISPRSRPEQLAMEVRQVSLLLKHWWPYRQ